MIIFMILRYIDVLHTVSFTKYLKKTQYKILLISDLEILKNIADFYQLNYEQCGIKNIENYNNIFLDATYIYLSAAYKNPDENIIKHIVEINPNIKKFGVQISPYYEGFISYKIYAKSLDIIFSYSNYYIENKKNMIYNNIDTIDKMKIVHVGSQKSELLKNEEEKY